jgi:hypothetical protein
MDAFFIGCRMAHRPRLNGLLAAIIVAASASSSVAALTAYEGFDYAASTDINGLSGGTGWSGNWAGTAGTRQVQSPGATYGTLSTVGNKAFVLGSTAGAQRVLPNPIGTADETLWISFIGQRDPAGPTDNGRFFSLSFYETAFTPASNERFSIGENSDNANNKWGMHFTSSPATNRIDVLSGPSIDSQAFLLARVNYHAGANDDIYLWVDYDIGLGEPAVETAHANSVGAFNLAFDRLAIRAGAATTTPPLASAQGFFDEIRLGTTFADVTPTGGGGTQPGDYNGDNKVDAADYVVWRKTDNTLPKYDEWRTNFGVGAASGAVAVPEPVTLALVVIGAALLMGRRYSRSA